MYLHNRCFNSVLHLVAGQFHHGEMHGHGLIQYPDGSRYEGDWSFNKQEGK